MSLKEKMHGRDSRKDRKDLEEEHPFGDAGQTVLLILFLIIWGMDSFLLKYSVFLSQFVPLSVRLFLMVLAFIPGGILAKSALNIVFGEVRENPHVISKGAFQYVRHPVYLGSLLAYLGFVISTLSLAALGLFVIICIFYNYIAAYEERKLEQRFGEEYLEYKKRVPRWIPDFRKKLIKNKG